MKIDNHLTEYDERLPHDQKMVFKYAIIVFAILMTICVVLTIFFNNLYTLIIGYGVGGVVSAILFYITQSRINSAYYGELDKVTKWLGITHKITYILTFFILLFVFKTIWVVIGAVFGLLLIKISIYIAYLSLKKNDDDDDEE